MPHHAIFLVGNGRTAYFDFCLDCRCLLEPHGLRLPAFDNRRWEELAQFVDQLGMSYTEP